jgi:WD40 repeat protein
MTRQLLIPVVFVSLCSLSSVFAQSPPTGQLRKWKDASGQFSVDAEFIGLTGGKVDLKKADGKIISIPLEKLAAEDQAVAKSLAEKATQPARAPAAPAAANVATSDGSRIEYVTYQGITQLAKLPDTSPWRGKPDPKPANVPALLTKPMFVPLAENESGEFTYVDDINHHAWVMILPQNIGPGLRFERIDLRTGERLAPTPTPHYQAEPVSISPSGRYAAVFNMGSDGLLRIIDLTANPPAKVRTICPFHEQALKGQTKDFDETKEGADIDNAIFLDDNQMLLQKDRRGLALVDLKTLRAKYFLDTIGIAYPSPGRKQVAVRSGSSHYHLVDTLTGKSLGLLESSRSEQFIALVFHPDASRLAAANQEKVSLWNLATGKLEQSHKVDLTEHPFQRIGFGKNADHLVIGGKTVINLKAGNIVGRVPVSAIFDRSFTHGGREWYLTRDEKQAGVSSLELPAE